MEDLSSTIPELEQFIANAEKAEKWVQQLEAFLAINNIPGLDKKEVQEALRALPFREQKQECQKLIDATSYYQRNKDATTEKRNKAWFDIAKAKIEQSELEGQIRDWSGENDTSAPGREDIEISSQNRNDDITEKADATKTNRLTEPSSSDTKLKRRRSLARRAVNTVKTATESLCRSKSKSRTLFDD